MKKLFGQILLLLFAAWLVFSWGRMIVEMIRNPWRTVEVIVVPSLCICVVVWTYAWLMKPSSRAFLRRNKWKLSATIIVISAAGIFVAHRLSEIAEGNRYLDKLNADRALHERAIHAGDKQQRSIYDDLVDKDLADKEAAHKHP